MKKFYDYSLTWQLLLVPVVATLSFSIYLVYSTLVLSDGNALLREVRDANFPTLDAAGKNLNASQGVVEALNSAAATGEVEFLDVATVKASEILSRYDALKILDTKHANEIDKLKSGFEVFFSKAHDVAQRMATKTDMPSSPQILVMRQARDAYLLSAVAYKDSAEKEFHETVGRAILRSERAQKWGAVIGTLMVLVIAALTLLVTRGIVVLESRVAERNKMLASVNGELESEIKKLKAAEEAKSHAEAASQIKDEFLANMSHELRTPMNAIIGLSHLCLQTEMSGKQHDYLQKIYGSGKSLLGILNDILDVSKIEAGKLELDRTSFDLEEVMDNLATIVGNQSEDKNLEFLLETAQNVPASLIGDPLRLGQVLINLAGNAVKFTDTGEVMVRVELAHEAGDQVTLQFTVSDTGIGMSQKEIDRLFQPFTQADTSITRKFGGTGLGLTISKRLVEMMGGKIKVESTPGAGSKFIFTARFKRAEKQGGYRQSVLNDMRGLRVLVVDDSESSLQILRSYLESFTFDVTAADNGLDALSAVSRANEEGRPFGLAILDWKMPNMDGVELARALRGMTELRVMPKILLISAHGQNEMALHTMGRVVDGVLAKPFQQSKLFDAIAKISGRDGETTGKFKIAAQFNQVLVAKIRGARLLLVEDNKINQQVAQELLENFGISVSIAENGEEAIALLNDEKFDGVLMDMQMPVMDGVSATREIRKNPKFVALPIIALTANVMISEQKEFLDAGMNDHIGKPIDPDKLVATLARWVRPTQPSTPRQAAKPQQSAVIEPLPDVPGIDVALGVRQVGGKVATFYSLLNKFSVDERNAVDEIRQALALSDLDVAERQVHTLKGIAGTLGAQTLQNQAEMLEDRIRNGTCTDIALQCVEQELVALIASIDHALEAR
jgi:signal transduction histidine kinase/DNA-binding response OmpR family regulator/HPt (histidine-containing phosphotransfer) domain-containing protein